MQIVSAREFRSNQGKFLSAAKNGELVILVSRYGKFKITPLGDKETLAVRTCQCTDDAEINISGMG